MRPAGPLSYTRNTRSFGNHPRCVGDHEAGERCTDRDGAAIDHATRVAVLRVAGPPRR
jgi:hypothetical protein